MTVNHIIKTKNITINEVFFKDDWVNDKMQTLIYSFNGFHFHVLYFKDDCKLIHSWLLQIISIILDLFRIIQRDIVKNYDLMCIPLHRINIKILCFVIYLYSRNEVKKILISHDFHLTRERVCKVTDFPS